MKAAGGTSATARALVCFEITRELAEGKKSDWVFHGECFPEGPHSLLTNTLVISTMMLPPLFTLAPMVSPLHTVRGGESSPPLGFHI